MGRKQSDSDPTRYTFPILFFLVICSCTLVYTFLSMFLRPNETSSKFVEEDGNGGGGCCRGMERVELWGSAVKWGSQFKFNRSGECCEACKEMCGGGGGGDGPCLCDSWVFCGDREVCGSKFGHCWLGIRIYGILNIKLFPDCAPHSVANILELLGLHHCAGCQFHRAEGRGQSWDSKGNHIKGAQFGPPFAMIQGTLDAHGTTFKKLPTESCPTIKRGSVAWVGSGPDFFISLTNHEEWNKAYTGFGSVLPKDMEIAERIAKLPTKADVWKNINVSVLEKPDPIWIRRIKTRHGNLNLNAGANSD